MESEKVKLLEHMPVKLAVVFNAMLMWTAAQHASGTRLSSHVCFPAVLSDYDSADPEENGSHSEVKHQCVEPVAPNPHQIYTRRV